jgi:hypothetical protein
MKPRIKKTARLDMRCARWEKELSQAGALLNSDSGTLSAWMVSLAVQQSILTLPMVTIKGILAKHGLKLKDIPHCMPGVSLPPI